MYRWHSILISLVVSWTGCADDDSVSRTYQPEQDVQTVMANGLEFAYFEEGDGPLVLLLHGFPDTPHTFDDIRPALAAAGYRAVSPFMRGYAPTSIPNGDAFTIEDLGNDVLALIEALGEPSAIVVGHDWGASAAYAAASIDPDRVSRLITVAIPHPATVVIDEAFLERGAHFLYLQEDDAEQLMRADDFLHVDELYARWSPTWAFEPSEVEPVKNVFSAPGSLTAALGYYRAASPLPPPFFLEPITVPTLAFAGLDDGVTLPEAFDNAASAFAGGYEVTKLPGGHFVHRESEQAFIDALLTYLDRE